MRVSTSAGLYIDWFVFIIIKDTRHLYWSSPHPRMCTLAIANYGETFRWWKHSCHHLQLEWLLTITDDMAIVLIGIHIKSLSMNTSPNCKSSRWLKRPSYLRWCEIISCNNPFKNYDFRCYVLKRHVSTVWVVYILITGVVHPIR